MRTAMDAVVPPTGWAGLVGLVGPGLFDGHDGVLLVEAVVGDARPDEGIEWGQERLHRLLVFRPLLGRGFRQEALDEAAHGGDVDEADARMRRADASDETGEARVVGEGLASTG